MGNDCEAGGPAVHVDALQCLGKSEAPMGEIWGLTPISGIWGKSPPVDHFFFNNTTRQAASAAHYLRPAHCRRRNVHYMGPHWEEDPALLKAGRRYGLLQRH